MDYEKKYKEALGWMQSLYDGLHGATKEDAEHYFPELRESEDERIRKALVNYFDDANKADENPLQSYGIHTDKVIAWLEKQGDSAIPQVYETKNGEVITYSETDGYKVVEPKFKVGDWITDGNITIQIEAVRNNCYLYDGDCVLYSTKTADKVYHLWTIADAKDGDILVASDGSIFLFGGVVDCACKYYIALTTDNYVKINKKVNGGYWETSRAVYPATKEQQGLLFQKMKEAGYEWSDKDRKLIKIVK